MYKNQSVTVRPPRKAGGYALMIFPAAIFLAVMAGAAFVPARADTVTVPVYAKLVQAVEITVNASLDFGDLAFTPDQAGEARIDPATNMLAGEGTQALLPVGGKPQAGQIVIRGAEYPVEISMEQPSVRLTNGHDFVTVSDFHFINAQTGSRVTVMPDPQGNDIILPIGATLRTRVGQMSGSYVGVGSIYAHYQ